ncbi:uncharacterized protein LOC133311691 isoform X2 [Gastrolobium bilobum]|uniref:uncharacterized protein LOC133311691 isoform X2 n=1 Tax=Gastrolobium bilobum TaxID=150636 RepID=UPI002AB1A3D2|nr:uncharacterized protein LOC133311691 isoform X2 [Gastrolobium bilobum]
MVQVDESFVPALKDEVMEVEHLLAEPRNDHVSVDSMLYFNEENVEKCYDAESLSCGFEFGLKSSIGGLDSHTTLNGKDDLELEVLDGLLDDVEIHDFEGTDGFSVACDEYLDFEFSNKAGYFLDFEFSNKAEVLGSGPCDSSLLQNSSSESHSSGLSGSSIVGGVSESTKVPIAQSNCKSDSLDETVTYESHGAFRSNPSQPSNVDCLYNISLDIQHLHGLDNDHHFAGGILSYEKGSVEKCQPAALREKRFRKPTQRYIEESSNLKSKEKVATAVTKNKHMSVSSCDELRIRLKALKKIPGEKSSNGNSDVTLSELQVCKGHPKKEKVEYDNESFSSESEDECLTPKRSRKKDRRKHQRMWNLSEVMKLVDGVSEYGVGRWTDIKRFLFSSSSYRTPIDLRDKWRNLLRASSAQKFNKKEAEQNDELALRPLPLDVACRVRELAKIHPYPRQRGSKKLCVSQVGSSAIVSQSKDSPPISLSKRNVRRNKFTLK